jgi:uncharacterized protein (TIGR02145 family)
MKEVQIGKQIWMAKNLNVDKFRNGDIIPQAKTNEEWERAVKMKKPAWCYYDNNPSNGNLYGKLYNWYAVNDIRGLAPKGFHVPDLKDWEILTNFLGGELEAGAKIKSKTGWEKDEHSSDPKNANITGFNAFPAGCRDNDEFGSAGYYAYWWCSSAVDINKVWYRYLDYSNFLLDIAMTDKSGGMSVRCLRD